ncbi:MAG: 30S ribosomal protein S12 methylthiotransferase RimO [Calditrichaceae bacterium]|nr:30S ribosomal protein S12 methylthiotransferase RimO [Calditrichaceae bacterium]MBN2710394.1 30S ribosomal protein S12 methylthiotransferase RimO [Calditrichaceae bacterium]RQV92884.1 MAG: 30S ribosomal protein S12 methylthiotransferase RimO [Calditrichota bacterium]
MKKIHITSLGCSKNTVDTEVLRGQLLTNGYTLVNIPETADILIINTCGFINDAKEESIQAILEAVELKKKDHKKQVFVAGCLSQRYPTEIKAEIPEVDAVFGTEDYTSILSKIKGKRTFADNLYQYRSLTTPAHYAYLKISEGCNHSCSFCAIPGIRGRHRSRTIEEIIAEARLLADKGVKELIVISQDTSYYGIDLYKSQKIISLLETLNEIRDLEWIRVMYWYPSNFPMEVVEMIKQGSKILPYLDIPIQHISDHVLHLMKRGDTGQSIRKKLYRIRELYPDIALRTTLILGHPGESDKDFDELISFINEVKFDRLGTFIYSDEDGTESYKLKNKVPRKTALERQKHIMEAQKLISLEKNQHRIGTVLSVIIDEADERKNIYSGRSVYDAPEIDNIIYLDSKGNHKLASGSIIKAVVNDASEYDLFATPVENSVVNNVPVI